VSLFLFRSSLSHATFSTVASRSSGLHPRRHWLGRAPSRCLTVKRRACSFFFFFFFFFFSAILLFSAVTTASGFRRRPSHFSLLAPHPPRVTPFETPQKLTSRPRRFLSCLLVFLLWNPPLWFLTRNCPFMIVGARHNEFRKSPAFFAYCRS